MSEYHSAAETNGVTTPLESRSARTRRWRGNWQIAVVVAVLVVSGGALWFLLSSHQPHKFALPATLLNLSKYTGPNAATDKADLEQQAQLDSGGTFAGVVGLYGNLSGGPAFALVAGASCTATSCLAQTSRQVVLSLRRSGDPAVRAFPLGGGYLVCNTYRNSNQIHCGWIDQVSEGTVFFAGGLTSNLSDAAAKTTQIIAAIEH